MSSISQSPPAGPQWKSPDWWTAVAHQAVSVLALAGVIVQGDAVGLESAASKTVAAVFVVVAQVTSAVYLFTRRSSPPEQPASRPAEPPATLPFRRD